MAPSTALVAVARVAFVASDVVVHGNGQSPFAPAIQSLLASEDHPAQQPSLISLLPGSDPGKTLLAQKTASLTSFLTTSHLGTIRNLVPTLTALPDAPLVIHIAVQDADLSNVFLLRASVPYFILSATSQQATDNALLSSRLARSERKVIVHIFPLAVQEGTVRETSSQDIRAYLVGKGTSNGVDTHSGDLLKAYNSTLDELKLYVPRPLQPLYVRGPQEPHTLLILITFADLHFELEGVSFVNISLLNPLPSTAILRTIPPSVKRVFVAEHAEHSNTKWSPLYLQVLSAIQQSAINPPPATFSVILRDLTNLTAANVQSLLDSSPSLSTPIHLGHDSPPQSPSSVETPSIPKHETVYLNLLDQVFGDRLELANHPSLVGQGGEPAISPEFALGRIRGDLDARSELISSVQDLLQDITISKELHSLLGDWLDYRDDPIKSRKLGNQITVALEAPQFATPPSAEGILERRSLFSSFSRWIIGSDSWSYDLGASGLHHVIASRLNINILVLDTVPYSTRNQADPSRRKKDVGLYAMNYGGVYVASVALYSSYSQVLQALVEADKFNGPSVVVAYLPYTSEETSALDVLKETKLAVDAGYWPLYRWNPERERQGKEPFILDSDSVKNDLQKFLDRQNHLSQLVRSRPEITSDLVQNLGDTLKESRRSRAKNTFQELLTVIDATPLRVLYASDGGKAEKVARRLSARAKLRGLPSTVAAMDTISLEDFEPDEFVVFITSVAGQGEFPQNGRKFLKLVNAAATREEKPLEHLRFSVFGMGDSHYWPRKEDAHYYNKAGKDLNARLEQLGGQRSVEFGLGDDQDADGPETGYKTWEPLLWKVLGVDAVELQEAEPEPITNEHIKAASQYLRGTIVQGLADTTTGALSPSDGQLTKFHGIYQQDDRDIRDERTAQGVEPAYSFMIRVRMPGGVCDPQQWLLMDQIADEHGNGTFKITTRQTFQFHGVIKRHLKAAIFDINRALLDTLAACGDVNRNVITSTIPSLTNVHAQAYEFAKRVSEHLLPQTTAYHEIWLDKKLVGGEAIQDVEPLYGEFYLPRKFKIAVAVPPNNDVDIFANDVGFIAIVENDRLVGFNVTAGGGMGVTHGNKKTYPRLGDVLGFCTAEQGCGVAEKIMLVQRDNGNRVDRKNARLKYTIDRMGRQNFKAEVERRLGYQLQAPRPFQFDRNVDDYGWVQGQDGKHHFTAFVENGRIQDEPGKEFKTALREIAKVHKGNFRLTANQHLIITDIDSADLGGIKALLAKYKLDNLSMSGLRLSASACVSFPTCGLAMAESERYLPLLVNKVEKICEENGLRHDSIVMRMTGCPNGCARPYVAEIAFVGKAPGTYMMLLGGGYYGQRLNKIYRESVTEVEILSILGPMIKQYALERNEGEHFGDFVIRAGYIAPTSEGKAWWDAMGGEGQHREVVSADL